MAIDTTVPALATATTTADADYLLVVQSGSYRKMAASEFFGRPRAIGAITPAAGSFTTVSGSGMVASATVGINGDSLEDYVTNTDTGAVSVNYNGYAGGTTKYRNFDVYDGKHTLLLRVTGSTATVAPGTDNTQTLGTAAKRWSVVYAGTGTINTSDAREKTAVAALSADEINAARELARAIGTYRWLDAVAAKGDAARRHIGLTVQRAIEIMQANNLDPMAYGFICYDQWADEFVDHPATEATDDHPARDAWIEQTQHAGDRYAFRYDELNLFIARGFEARLSALEAA